MQLHKFIRLTCLTLVIASCSEQQARKPVSHSSGSFMKESIQRNKKLVAKEEDAIAKIIKKDTANAYIASEKGYWYTYEEKSTETTTPIRGDIAYFDYEITDLYGNIIYTKEELKPQTYYVDKQNIMTGLRHGIKLMHKGDKIKFVFTSHMAYGYHGDDDKIGTNQPIICIVTLNDIKKDNSVKTQNP